MAKSSAAVAEKIEPEVEDTSLHDDLVAALRATETPEEPEEIVEPVDDAAPAEAVEEAVAEPDTADPEAAAAAEPAEVAALDAPAHWSPADKEQFAALGDGHKKWLLDTRKQIEKGAQAKFDAAAEARKLHEEVVHLASPYAEQMKQHGMTPADAVRHLFAAQQMLIQDPVRGFATLAESYGRSIAGSEQARQLVQQMATHLGVDLGAPPVAPAPGAGQATDDPTRTKIATLEERLAAFEREREESRRSQQQASLRTAETQLNAFTEAKDAAGNPKHPHFERVRRTMALMVQASSQAGESLTLEDAYDRAVHADPELRQQMTVAEQERVAKQAAEARRAHAAKAERARTPKTASVSNEPPPDQSLRDDLMDTYRDVSARVRS